MNIFVSILFLVSLAIAEPPVGDGYPAARSSHDHHQSDHGDHHDLTSDHQRSLSQEYGPPSFASRNAISGEYSAPNARSSHNTGRQSQKHAPPTVRVSFNQRFSSAAARNSHQDQTPAAGLSQGYAPNPRSGISQEYGPPAARSLSQEYGVPSVVSARTLSTEYGMPDARSTPSQEYGVPVVAARSNQKSHLPASNFHSAQSGQALSQDYSAPASRSQFQLNSQSHGYATPSVRSNKGPQNDNAPKPFSKSAFSSQSPSQTYGTPKSEPSSRSLSTTYGAPFARSSESLNSVSQTYDAPNQRDLSETYNAPNARSLSQEYGAPSSRNNLKTDAVASSYALPSSRSAPSSSYLPAARDVMPSQEYGVPDQDNKANEEARARALNELLNQEPANYDFAYQIEDQESGSDFGHTETRQENRAEGSYFVVLPDGTKQTVEYEADERGYQPRISVEPAAGGYDDNAAEVASARTSGGPY